MGCGCGCGSPGACRALENARSMLDVARQLVNTGAITERDAVRALTDAMTAFSDAARPASDAALAFNYAVLDLPVLPLRTRAHDEPIEITYEFRLDEETALMGYNGRPLTDALRAAMPRMIDSIMTGTTSDNTAPSEPLTLDALRAARARLPEITEEAIVFDQSGFVEIGDVVMNDSRAIGVVESTNANGSVNVRFSGRCGVEVRTDVRRVQNYEARRVTPAAAAPESKKLPVRKIILDGDLPT